LLKMKVISAIIMFYIAAIIFITYLLGQKFKEDVHAYIDPSRLVRYDEMRRGV